MKKLVYLVIGLLSVLCIVGCLFFLITDQVPTWQNIQKTFKVLKGDGSSIEDLEVVSTTKAFEFKEPKVKNAVTEEAPALSKNIIYLYLGDDKYYPVAIPTGLDIVTDYSKYIYAKDSSLSVTVVSGVTKEGLSSMTNIRKPVALNPALVRSEIGTKGPQEAAKLVVDDKAIVVRAYDNPIGFATVLWSLQEKVYQSITSRRLEIDKLDTEEDGDKMTEVYYSLPKYTGYIKSVGVNLGSNVHQAYVFGLGTLTIAREFKLFDECIELMGTRANVLTKRTEADAVYCTDTVYYAEVGNCSIGVVVVNYNTTITLFGIGDEARFNITEFLRDY